MSLLIDTNVISELVRKFPNPDVKKWVADQPAETLFISTVSEAELLYGAEVLPAGKRREKLISNIENLIRDAFGGRVLPFDRLAAVSMQSLQLSAIIPVIQSPLLTVRLRRLHALKE